MLIMMPEWYTEAEEEIKKTIHKIVTKNFIDYHYVLDSKGIEEGKRLILQTLVNIWEDVKVEERERLQKFAKSIEIKDKDKRPSKKNSKRENKKHPYRSKRK